MLALIGVLFFSRGEGHVPPYLAELVITIALVQLGISYAFQLWLMRLYKEKDVLDWLLRLSLVPEFAYSYLMTFALLGSYVFHFFVVCKRPRGRRGLAVAIENLFRTLGYAERQWGTRATHTI
jgi:hypothetical protein